MLAMVGMHGVYQRPPAAGLSAFFVLLYTACLSVFDVVAPPHKRAFIGARSARLVAAAGLDRPAFPHSSRTIFLQQAATTIE